jgi:TonB family protein
MSRRERRGAAPARRTLAGWAGLALAAGVVALPAEPAPDAGALMALPEVRSWVAPVYPPEAAGRKQDGRAQVRLVIDATGAVTGVRALRATDPAFAAAAVQSVRQWRFSPALEDGHPVAKCMDVTLPFRWADRQRGPPPAYPPAEVLLSLAWSPRTGPAKIGGGDPDYPDSLLARHLKGEVDVRFDLAADGSMRGVQVLRATHADFIRPALAAAERWKFRPAMQGDLAVPTPMETALEFEVLEPKPVDMLAANGISLADAPAALDSRPGVRVLVDPVYPYDLLLAGTEGDAVVDFVIAASGRPEAVAVREAARPEFGRAFAAAVECWRFKPAWKDGAAVPVRASARWHFGAETAAGRAVARLVQRMRADDTAGMGARGLDGALKPRYQVSPVYPAARAGEKPAGEAQISFIIDRDGRARLARVISATREDLGWAAATAVERWVFDPPRRGGQPTDVRVSIPFNFEAP